jgi:IS30 family transposase
MPWTHLTLGRREVLAQRTCRGEHPDEIAAVLGCHRGTVYREWRRNGRDGEYFPARAQAAAAARRRASKAPWKMGHPPLADYVQDRLAPYWSPQQISGRLRRDFPDEPAMRISHPALYDWIASQKAQGGIWHTFLRQARRRRRKRYGRRENRGRIVGRVGIEERPPEVAAKVRPGHWESDTIVHGPGPTARREGRQPQRRHDPGLPSTWKPAPLDHHGRQRQGVRRPRPLDRPPGTAGVLRPAVPLVGTRTQREHQRPGPSVLPQGP